MDAYINYDFYKNEYKGSTIPESAFDELALKATIHVNNATFNRIVEVTDMVKIATCAAAEELLKIKEKDGISSESVGKVSVTYLRNSKSVESRISSVIAPYLMSTGLMSRPCTVWGW